MKIPNFVAAAVVSALIPLSAIAQQTDCRIANFVGDWRINITLFNEFDGITFQNICDVDLNEVGIGRAVCLDYYIITDGFGGPAVIEPEMVELGVRMSSNPNNCVVRASFDIVEEDEFMPDAIVVEARAYSSRGGWPKFVDGFIFATILDPELAAIHPIPAIPGTLTMQRRGWETPYDLLAAWDDQQQAGRTATAPAGPRRHVFRAR